jgi:DNA-binding CsgD family transcriptional regulator
MRLEIEVTDNAVRLSSPEVPGMVRLARGQDQLWREFRNFIAAHRGVEAGTWKVDQAATIDELVKDAESSTSTTTRTAARRVRESWTRLQKAVEESKAADAAEAERLRLLAEAEQQLRQAEQSMAQAREKVRGLKKQRKGTPLASPGTSRSAAAAGRVVLPASEIAKRRERVKHWLDSGVTAPAAIAARLGVDPKTVSNDLRALKASV